MVVSDIRGKSVLEWSGRRTTSRPLCAGNNIVSARDVVEGTGGAGVKLVELGIDVAQSAGGNIAQGLIDQSQSCGETRRAYGVTLHHIKSALNVPEAIRATRVPGLICRTAN